MASAFHLSKSNILRSLNSGSVCPYYFLCNVFLAVFFLPLVFIGLILVWLDDSLNVVV